MATVEKPSVETVEKATAGTDLPESRGLAGRRRKFTVDDYDRMAEAGILKRGERVELIEGDVIAMCPIGSRHAGCVACLNGLLTRAIGPRAIVAPQNPVRLDHQSEPEPDFALLRPRPDFYRSALPGPADVLLVIEVMDSSADHDRGVKLGLYARAGVPEVWLVDLDGELVEVHRRPAGGAYAESRAVPRGQGVSPEVMADVVLAVDAILG